ncbi:MAG: mechanosensitive ion channel family protein [Thiogranum sp.]
MPENYSLPEVTQIAGELNKFGVVIVHSLYYLIIAVIVIFLVHKFAQKILYPRLANKRFAIVIILAMQTLVLVTALLLVLGQLGFDITVTAPVALLGVIAVAVIVFFIAPLLPSLPFRFGDMVEIEGTEGSVDSVTPIFTHIQTFDGRTVFIPNTLIWSKKIVNYHFTPNRRVELKLNVSVDHSLADARAVLTDIMHSDERVLDDPAPITRINSAEADGVEMVGLAWVKNDDFLGARSDMYEKVVNAAQSEAGISLSLDRQQIVLSGEVASR